VNSADVQETLRFVAVGAARTIPIAWSIPAFGGPSLPTQVRLTIGIGLAFLCLPAIAGTAFVGGAVLWGLLLIREVVVGLVMGFVIACMFRASEAAGQLMDEFRGAGLSEVIAPTGAGGSSPLGVLLLLLTSVTFFEIGGLAHVTSALVRSYEAIPIVVPVEFARGTSSMAKGAVASSAKLIESAVGLCAPAIVAFLLADIVLGVVGRTVPQIPLYFVGTPLKALLGAGAVLLVLASLSAVLQDGFHGFFALLGATLHFQP